jgi:hypothetical protein
MLDFFLAIYQYVLDNKVNDLSLLIFTSCHKKIIVWGFFIRRQMGLTLGKKIVFMIFRLSV